MSEMPSDPYQQDPQYQQIPYPEVPLQDDDRPVTGRTFWDMLAGKGFIILAILIVVAVSALVILKRDEIDWAYIMDLTMETVKEYWYVAVGPVVGLIAGDKFAQLVHRPDCRVVLTLRPEDNTVQALVVPEQYFRMLNQSGNNVVYHSPMGMPVYLAQEVDLERGFVHYGWVHEHDALLVFTKQSFYDEWKDTLDRAMADNLKLMDSPEVYGMQFAGEALKRHLDRMGAAVGVTKESSGGPSDYSEPNPVDDAEGGDPDDR